MSIPLDRLYHYIESIAEDVYHDSVIIYRFWPHGSKNIKNMLMLTPGTTWGGAVLKPVVYCADQEPLQFDYYQQQGQNLKHQESFNHLIESLGLVEPQTETNFRVLTVWNQFEKAILIHSEQRSDDVIKYRSADFVPVYYWSHALIALDWFRYAQHEVFTRRADKTFLIYNRAWSGTREYRLKFADLLIQQGLADHCQTSVNAIEPELNQHYDQHQFQNPAWRPQHVLENYFPGSTASSHYSADFDRQDYDRTEIEVVLETLFDDSRLHLTEKSLRPIACGQPFILAGTVGSLEYLRSYGFRTFDHIWDESYDTISDPESRLLAITDLMKQIAGWDPATRTNKLAQARAVAKHNREYFFSKEFFDRVVNELVYNLKSAFDEVAQGNNGTAWLAWWDQLITHPEIVAYLDNNTYQGCPNMQEYRHVREILTGKKHVAK